MSRAAASRSYRRVRNLLLLFIALAGGVLAVQLLLNFLIMPRMRIGQILLESSVPLSDGELLRLGGLSGRVNYLSLDERAVQERFEASPLIRKAYVEKQFPRTLKVVLYGREALGSAFPEVEGLLVPLLFDDRGVVFYRGSRGETFDLPVFSGGVFSALREGSVLPEILHPLLEDLQTLRRKAPLLFDQISEIRIEEKGEEHFDLTLYMSAYPVPVILGPGLDEGLVKKILLVLDVLKSRSQLDGLAYADFRSDQVVLKMREDR